MGSITGPPMTVRRAPVSRASVPVRRASVSVHSTPVRRAPVPVHSAPVRRARPVPRGCRACCAAAIREAVWHWCGHLSARLRRRRCPLPLIIRYLGICKRGESQLVQRRPFAGDFLWTSIQIYQKMLSSSDRNWFPWTPPGRQCSPVQHTHEHSLLK